MIERQGIIGEKMIELRNLEKYIDELLMVKQFDDYAPNGLQVEGRKRIGKIVTAVTASQAVLDQAIIEGADAILVHHGYFWKGEAQAIVGIKQRRVKTLLQADVSLLGYHLPLDAHPMLGNNAELAKVLNLKVESSFANGIAFMGVMNQPCAGEIFAQRITEALGRKPLHIAGNNRLIKKIAWCSGGAQGYLEGAAMLGADAYLTGEASEQSFHNALELGVHFYAAGHHATERYGIKALGEHLAERFGLQHHFIDQDNPV